MTTVRAWEFPLLALAVSSRKVALVAMGSALRIDALATWETRRAKNLGTTARRIADICAWLEPRTLVVTGGARWSAGEVSVAEFGLGNVPAEAHRDSMGLAQACAILGCEASLAAIAARITDAYPDMSPRLACFSRPKRRTDAMREGRPLLSALAVAHAASVAHLIQFG